jgi:hypothetical protein
VLSSNLVQSAPRKCLHLRKELRKAALFAIYIPSRRGDSIRSFRARLFTIIGTCSVFKRYLCDNKPLLTVEPAEPAAARYIFIKIIKTTYAKIARSKRLSRSSPSGVFIFLPAHKPTLEKNDPQPWQPFSAYAFWCISGYNDLFCFMVVHPSSKRRKNAEKTLQKSKLQQTSA